MATSLANIMNRIPYKRQKSDRGEPKYIGNPILTQTTNKELNRMPPQHNARYAYGMTMRDDELPPVPPKDNKRTSRRPAATSQAHQRAPQQLPRIQTTPLRPFQPLDLSFNANSSQSIDSRPVSPLSVMPSKHTRRKPSPHDGPEVSPLEPEFPNRDNMWDQPPPVPSLPAAHQYSVPSYSNTTLASKTGFASDNTYKYKAGKTAPQIEPAANPYRNDAHKHTTIDDWVKHHKEKEMAEAPPRPPPQSTKTPSPPRQRAPAVVPKLQIRQSVFQPLRNSLVNTAIEPLPPVPPTPLKVKSKIPIAVKPADKLGYTDGSKRPEMIYDEILRTLERASIQPADNGRKELVAEDFNSPIQEERPKDHLSELEDEQDRVEKHRIELRGKIYHLEHMLPMSPNALAPAEIKQHLDSLNAELADVEKELHDLGLKIHRALRRRDKMSGVEGPTHLWVSRIVG